MKVLVLVAERRLPNNEVMYNAMGDYIDLEVIKVSVAEQKKLSVLFKQVDVQKFDRIILDLHFKRLVKQARFVRTLPRLVIFEEDACQNNIKNSKWFGKFLPFYKKLGSFRLVCTSARLVNMFKAEGIDACFLQKGYDQEFLKNQELTRDIELGFIGRISSQTYAERNRLLSYLNKKEGLELLRTAPGDDYAKMLNRIRIFVSADIGLGEYMAKNFEAMASGCLVLAYQQGVEEEAMGLKDMENIVLYKSIDSLIEKLSTLRANASLVSKVAHNGQLLAEDQHGFNVLGQCFVGLLEKDIPLNESLGFFRRFF